MDINENLQQTNTFAGGMDTDTSDMLIKSDKYRFAKNLRLITDSDSNSGELHLIEGGDQSYRDSLVDEDGDPINDWNHLTIIKTTQIRDYGILIAKHDGGYWYIYTIHDGVRKRIFGPCGESLGENLSLVTRYETEDVIKLYIADGMHSLMSINILDKIDPQADTSYFTNISRLTTVKAHQMNKPIVTSTGTAGTFKPGMVQYAYILYNKYGSHTNISPLSDMYNVTTGNRGESAAKTVSFSANISIDETVSNLYKKIKLYRILYTQIGQDPIVSLIADADLTYIPFTYQDSGINIANLSVDEFVGIDNYNIFPNEIESKNDYLFSGNVKDYLKANQDIYNKLKQDIDDGKFQLNTLQQLGNLNFNNTYNDQIWPNHIDWTGGSNQNGYLQWKANRVASTVDSCVYMTDEIYRFGIVLYDKNGITWPVIWIADLRTSPNPDIEGSDYYSHTYSFRFTNNLGAFIERYSSFFTDYEIVRCNRTWGDKHVLSQGIAGRALQSYKYNIPDGVDEGNNEDGIGEGDISKPNAFLMSSGFMTFTDVVIYSKLTYLNDARRSEWGMGEEQNCREFSSASDKYLIFSSPEACYQQDDLTNAMKQYKQSLKFKTRYYRNIPIDKDSYNLSCHFGDSGIGFYTLRMYCEHLTYGIMAHTYSLVSVDYSKCDNKATDDWIYGGPNFRSAMWFPIFEYKRSTPEYRDTSVIRSDRGETWDKQHDWVQPIKNVMTAGDVINAEQGNNIPNGDYAGRIEEFQGIVVPQSDQFMTGDNLSFRDNSTIINDRELLAWSVPGYAGAVEKDLNVKNTYIEIGEADPHRSWLDHEDYYSFYRIPTLSINFPVSAIGTGIILQTDAQFEQQDITVPKVVQDNDPTPWGQHYQDHITDRAFYDYYYWTNNTQIDYPDQPNFRLNYYPGLPQGSQFTLPTGYASVPIVDIINDAVVPYGGLTDYARQHSVYQSFGCYDSIGGGGVTVPGDCFYNMFEYNSAKSWYNSKAKYAPHMTTVYKVPLLSSIHMNLDHGDKFSVVNEDYRIQDTPSEVRGYVQDKPAYAYNTAYSNQNSAKFYVGNSYDEDNMNCDVRIFNSAQKTNGESIDKWLEYKPSSFIDVDSRYGTLTNLKLFKDTLLFNQEKATGILSVNERTLIEDTNGENIILGNGSVLQRYDYISTVYGMHKGDHACGNSDTTFYWWDRDNKDILMYNRNGFAPMKTVKNIRKYIDTQDLSQSNPVVIYDNKYSEMLFGLGNNKLLSYNEVTQRFTSEYDQNAQNAIYLSTQLILVDDNKLYEWNKRAEHSVVLPYIKYIVNDNPTYNKVFDNIRFGGRFYGGDTEDLQVLTFTFNTPLKQHSTTTGADLTNYEYDFRMSVPRDNNADAGGRMRGKTMECIIESSDTSEDFSLQYITTKFRMSWT